MTDRDPTGMPDGRELIASMGWETLPFGCVGMIRKAEVPGGRAAWSWLILIPWAANDAKPWIDGTELVNLTAASEDEQREELLRKMREILDARYGDTLGEQAMDRFFEQFGDG